jgi:hypothetical protein
MKIPLYFIFTSISTHQRDAQVNKVQIKSLKKIKSNLKSIKADMKALEFHKLLRNRGLMRITESKVSTKKERVIVIGTVRSGHWKKPDPVNQEYEHKRKVNEHPLIAHTVYSNYKSVEHF